MPAPDPSAPTPAAAASVATAAPAIATVALPPPGSGRQRKRQAPKGRRVGPEARAEIAALLADQAPPQRDRLIEHLHRIQDRFGQLATPHLAALAEWMKLSQAEVHEVASFYHHFDIVHEDAEGRVPPPPALTVRVCDGLSCQLAGAQGLLQGLPARLGTGVRLLPAPCVGRCEQAPVAVVHQRPLPQATPAAVQAAAEAALAASPWREAAAGEAADAGRAAADTPQPDPQQNRQQDPRHDPRHDHVDTHLDLAAYRAQGGYTLLADCLQGRRPVAAVLDALDHSGLRGLGGAGFPAGRKWRIVRDEPAPRLMAVNIDEGEPGTFKDRWLLERDPHRFLEGMLIAAWAVGVAGIWIYLRDEYHGIRAMLQQQLTQLQDWAASEGLALPPVQLRRGAGAYICGEESAMIESIEGKRGLPRLRPPYVAQRGLFGRPTLAHNLETLYWVRELLTAGPEAFAAHGRHGRRGLRRFSVSGRVKAPGVKLAPAGITLRELVDEHCGGMAEGHQLYGYLPGGASGGILPAALADLPLDFDTLQPHGSFIGSAAVVVLSQADRASDAARHTLRFFEDESCGQCTPCRAGTARARQLIATDRWDRPLLAELSQLMRDASICGLGQAAPNPVDSVLRHFPQELAE